MTQPGLRIRDRAELVDALSVAAQVEHLVLVEYLYAAFSCRHTQDPTVPVAVQLRSWELARELYLIAHDEMDHLGAVQQLLAALGAPPVPDAWAFPVSDPRLPFPCELTRLDLDAVDRFIATESAVAVAEALLPGPPDPIRFDVLGDLYRAIVAGLRRLGDAVFVGAPVTGPDPSPLTFRFGRYRVATAADAIRTIETVITEGEGASGTQPGGHWKRFVDMRTALERLEGDAQLVSWPCVRNPVLVARDAPGTTPLTDPVTVAVADIANRVYRALWLLLGGTYVHDWSAADVPDTVARRQELQDRCRGGARRLMATGLRPLGEILARLPAFAGEPGGPTAGLCFEQYGEFRVPAQPDARLAAVVDELTTVAADLDTVAAEPALRAPWAGRRLASMALDMRTIRDRVLGLVGDPARSVFEPPIPGRWLTVDFSGWYQVRLATGGDPYNDPRGASGWQFAYPGEPDLDRVIRFQPAGVFLRPHLHPGIRVGVRVRHADLDGTAVTELVDAPVELLDDPVFEGRNGVMAADGDEPIVPLTLRIAAGGGLTLARSALDDYRPPYTPLAALGAFADLPAARALRVEHGIPERVLGADGLPTAEMTAYLTAAADRLTAAIADADPDDALILSRRRLQLGRPPWPLGAVVCWRLPLRGTRAVAQAPDHIPAPVTGSPWWLELLSTGFDPDAGCALVRGVLHAPLTANAGPPSWRIALEEPTDDDASPGMPRDEMGVRPGR